MFMCTLFLLLLLVLATGKIDGKISNMNYVPQGTNPTLYEAGHDPVVQLDSSTFYDTVFKQQQAFVVEFYADWCGHCRAFAPHYVDFAVSVRRWKNVVTIAAINCADVFNQKVCSEQGIIGYPMILYYPRLTRYHMNAIKLEPKQSLSQMRHQLAQVIRNEYNQYHHVDWPDFSYLTVDSALALKHLWNRQNDSRNYLVLLFEQFDAVGVEFLLDMFPAQMKLLTRRVVSTPIIRPFVITQLPYVLVFMRNQDKPIYQSPYGPHILEEVIRITSLIYEPHDYQVLKTPFNKQQSIIECEENQERCRQLYYVSETDMLKAIRMALYDEVIKTNDDIGDSNFTALLNFVSLLAEYFPIYTSAITTTTTAIKWNQKSFTTLKQNVRAKMIFSHLQHFLRVHGKKRAISIATWQNQFLNTERVYGYPFPTNASWEHCKGTSAGFRGYTCGLWTTFHAITVSAYMHGLQNPLRPLLCIKDWVANFFGCLDCRQHFLHMTSTLYPMTKRRVRHAYDTILYLWRAHNILNARLHGDNSTEDPQFTKQQFPPFFLCSPCHSNKMFNRKHVRNFLVSYYTAIRPYMR